MCIFLIIQTSFLRVVGYKLRIVKNNELWEISLKLQEKKLSINVCNVIMKKKQNYEFISQNSVYISIIHNKKTKFELWDKSLQ